MYVYLFVTRRRSCIEQLFYSFIYNIHYEYKKYCTFYIFFQTSDNIILFWGNGVLPESVSTFLEREGTAVVVRPYTEIFDYLNSMAVRQFLNQNL